LLNTGELDTVVLLVVASQMMRGLAPKYFSWNRSCNVLIVNQRCLASVVRSSCDINYLTDRPLALPVLHRNVAINAVDKVQIRELILGQMKLDQFSPAYDVILGAPTLCTSRTCSETYLVQWTGCL